MSSQPTPSASNAALPAAEPALWTYAGTLRRAGLLIAVGQFGGMALGFLSNTLLVRVAAQESVASYLLLLQAIMAVGIVLQAGLAQATVRFVPLARGDGGTTATASARKRLLGLQGSMWLLLVPPLALLWPGVAWRLGAPQLATATPFLLAAAVALTFNNLADPYLRVFRLYARSTLLSHLLPRAVLAGGFLALLFAGWRDVPWQVLASIYLGAQLAAMIGYAAVLPATTPFETSEPRLAQPPPGIGEIFSTTLAMGLRGGISVLLVSSDLWILSWATHSVREVAVYGVMVTLLQLMGVLPQIANLIVPQEFTTLHADGRRRDLKRLARTAATAVGLVSLVSFAALALLGRPLIALAFGPEYLAGWGILLVLAVGRFWDAAAGSAGAMLQMTGHHVLLLVLTLGAALANVGLSLVLAPRYGGWGVALASSATLVAINVAMVAAVRRRIGVRTFIYLEPREWLDVARLLAPRRQR